MHPELITLFGYQIKTYGFFLMVGFLTAVWMAIRRGTRSGIDADKTLDVAFVLLISGVAGARLFFVIHYWESQFADRSNRLWAVLDLRQGGLEFLGGLLGATFATIAFLVWRKQSVRLFLDLATPSVMWGLAVGRLGCFFNGCCFGAPCTTDERQTPPVAWAVQFPFGSPAHRHQWEHRQITIPAELIVSGRDHLEPVPIPEELLRTKIEKLDGPRRRYLDAKESLDKAKSAEVDSNALKRLDEAVQAARESLERSEREYSPLRWAQQFPSRKAPGRAMLVSELNDLAKSLRSLPVHPAQLYAAINGFILAGLLAVVYSRRKRHGVVFALLLLLYPVARMIEEVIRVDNPHDAAGLTISQLISVLMLVTGAVAMWVLYKKLPLRSPYADAAAPPPADAVPAAVTQ